MLNGQNELSSLMALEDKTILYQAITGAGKTAFAVDFLCSYTTKKQKYVYATRTRIELCEFVMRIAQYFLDQGVRSDNVIRKITNTFAIKFTLKTTDGETLDLSVINDSNSWSQWQKDVLAKIIELNVISRISKESITEVASKTVLLTTQEGLLTASLQNNLTDRIVICDEVPQFCMNLNLTDIETKINYAKIVELASKTKGDFIDMVRKVGVALQSKVCELIEKTDENGNVFQGVVLSKEHPFKKLIIMSASYGPLYLLREHLNLKVVKSKLNNELIDLYYSLLDIRGLDFELHKSIAKHDRIASERDLSDTLVIATGSSTLSVDQSSSALICTNKTGINSLSSFTKVLVASDAKLHKSQDFRLRGLFGDALVEDYEFINAGEVILQSVFRGSIRKREAMEVEFTGRYAIAAFIRALFLNDTRKEFFIIFSGKNFNDFKNI